MDFLNFFKGRNEQSQNRKKTNTPQRSQLKIEPLEERCLLALAPLPAIPLLTHTGEVVNGSDGDSFIVTLNTQNAKPGAKDEVYLTFKVEATALGGLLKPSDIEIKHVVNGTPYSLPDNNLIDTQETNPSASALIAKLKPGETYQITVKGDGGSFGSYRCDVFLPGVDPKASANNVVTESSHILAEAAIVQQNGLWDNAKAAMYSSMVGWTINGTLVKSNGDGLAQYLDIYHDSLSPPSVTSAGLNSDLDIITTNALAGSVFVTPEVDTVAPTFAFVMPTDPKDPRVTVKFIDSSPINKDSFQVSFDGVTWTPISLPSNLVKSVVLDATNLAGIPGSPYSASGNVYTGTYQLYVRLKDTAGNEGFGNTVLYQAEAIAQKTTAKSFSINNVSELTSTSILIVTATNCTDPNAANLNNLLIYSGATNFTLNGVPASDLLAHINKTADGKGFTFSPAGYTYFNTLLQSLGGTATVTFDYKVAHFASGIPVVGTESDTYTVTLNIVAVGNKPAAPASFSAAQTASGTVGLSWNAVTSTPAVTGYRLEVKAPGSSWVAYPTTTAVTQSVNMLPDGVTPFVVDETYEFRVVAINIKGESTPSTVGSVTISDSVPAAPTNVTATPGVNSVTLNWVHGTGGATRTNYLIYYSTVQSDVVNNIGTPISVSASTTSHVVPGLTAGTTYYFKVVAVAGTQTAASAIVSAVPDPSSTTLATPVIQSLTNAVADPTKATLTWNAVTDAGGYKVEYSVDNGTTWIPATTSNILSAAITGITASFINLNPASAYKFRVCATATGKTDSGWAESAILVAVPNSAALAPAISSVSSDGVTLTSIPNYNTRKYNVYYLEDVPGWDAPLPTVLGFAGTTTMGNTTFDVTGLDPNKQYKFFLKEVNARGETSNATENYTRTIPAVPAIISLNWGYTLDPSKGDSEVTLTWTAAIFGETSLAIEYYHEGVLKTVDVTGVTSKIITGLKANTEYEFFLVAKNERGAGSSTTTKEVLTYLSTVGFTYVNLGDFEATLEFPLVPGADHYEFRNSDGSPITDANFTWDSASKVTVTWTSEMTYNWVLFAYDATDTVVNKSVIFTWTLTEDESTAPDQIDKTTIEVKAGTGPASIAIAWDVPFDGNASITGYEIRYAKADDLGEFDFDWDDLTNGYVASKTSTTPNVTVSGLDADTEYVFWITATNAANLTSVPAISDPISTYAAVVSNFEAEVDVWSIKGNAYKVKLTWDAYVVQAGETVSYVIEVYDAADDALIKEIPGVNVLTWTYLQLAETTYYYTVKAVFGALESGWATSGDVETDEEPIVTDQIESPNCAPSWFGDITVTWDPVADCTGYLVEWYNGDEPGDDDWSQFGSILGASETSVTFYVGVDFNFGDTVWCRITALGNDVDVKDAEPVVIGPIETVVDNTTAAPTNVDVASKTDTSLTVTWDKPVNEYADPRYEVQVLDDAGVPVVGVTVTVYDFYAKVSGLEQNTVYTFRVIAIYEADSGADLSAATDSAEVLTFLTAPTVTGTSTFKNDSCSYFYEVELSWDRSTVNGAMYIIEKSTDGGATWSGASGSIEQTATLITFTEKVLQGHGENAMYRVIAIIGDYSDPDNWVNWSTNYEDGTIHYELNTAAAPVLWLGKISGDGEPYTYELELETASDTALLYRWGGVTDPTEADVAALVRAIIAAKGAVVGSFDNWNIVGKDSEDRWTFDDLLTGEYAWFVAVEPGVYDSVNDVFEVVPANSHLCMVNGVQFLAETGDTEYKVTRSEIEGEDFCKIKVGYFVTIFDCPAQFEAWELVNVGLIPGSIADTGVFADLLAQLASALSIGSDGKITLDLNIRVTPTSGPSSGIEITLGQYFSEIDDLDETPQFTFNIRGLFFGGEASATSSDFTLTVDVFALDTPKNVKVDDVDAESATISWDPVDNADGYEVLVRSRARGADDLAWASATPTISYTGTQAEISDLDPDLEYEFKVIAKGDGTSSRDSNPSDPVFLEAVPETPDAPVWSAETDGNGESITIPAGGFGIWIASTDDASSAVEIEFSDTETSGTITLGTDDIDWEFVDGNIIITGLESDVAYYLFASATNSRGTVISDSAEVMPLAAALDAPELDSVTHNSVTLDMTELVAGVEAGVTYVIAVYDEDGAEVDRVDWDGVETEVVVTGLLAETTYSFRVLAINLRGTSEGDESDRITTLEEPVITLDAPEWVVGFPKATWNAVTTCYDVELQWEGDWATDPIKFIVQNSYDGLFWADLEEVTDTSVTVPQSPGCTTYYRVIAVFDVDGEDVESEPSTIATITTDSVLDDAPLLTYETDPLEVTTVTTSVDLTFTITATDLTALTDLGAEKLEVRIGGVLVETIDLTALTATGDEFTVTWTDVPATAGDVSVTITALDDEDNAVTNETTLAPITVVDLASAPGAVTDVAATGTSYDSIELTWTAAVDGTDEHGDPLPADSYEVRYVRYEEYDSEFDWADADVATGATATGVTVSGLDSGTRYVFQITASNAAGSASFVYDDTDATTWARPTLEVEKTYIIVDSATGYYVVITAKMSGDLATDTMTIYQWDGVGTPTEADFESWVAGGMTGTDFFELTYSSGDEVMADISSYDGTYYFVIVDSDGTDERIALLSVEVEAYTPFAAPVVTATPSLDGKTITVTWTEEDDFEYVWEFEINGSSPIVGTDDTFEGDYGDTYTVRVAGTWTDPDTGIKYGLIGTTTGTIEAPEAGVPTLTEIEKSWNWTGVGTGVYGFMLEATATGDSTDGGTEVWEWDGVIGGDYIDAADAYDAFKTWVEDGMAVGEEPSGWGPLVILEPPHTIGSGGDDRYFVAVESNGHGDYKVSASLTTITPPAITTWDSGECPNVTVTVSGTKVTVTWDSVVGAEGYHVQYYDAADPWDVINEPVDNSTFEFEFTGDYDATYWIKVRAFVVEGDVTVYSVVGEDSVTTPSAPALPTGDFPILESSFGVISWTDDFTTMASDWYITWVIAEDAYNAGELDSATGNFGERYVMIATGVASGSFESFDIRDLNGLIAAQSATSFGIPLVEGSTYFVKIVSHSSADGRKDSDVIAMKLPVPGDIVATITEGTAVVLDAMDVELEVPGVDGSKTNVPDPGNPGVYGFPGDAIDDLRAISGVVGLEVNIDIPAGQEETLSLVKITVTTSDGDLDTAYLFATDGAYTYEVIATGFLGDTTTGTKAEDLATLSSLTFFAKEGGTYTITFELLAFNTDVDTTLASGILLASGSLDVEVLTPV
ncbi:MAG: fibronectin type III domain-containing protein [Planctomycetaceae bacterium]|nr:fibronectin type III domain-containing protein [Planctomycetaceae bacterium]